MTSFIRWLKDGFRHAESLDVIKLLIELTAAIVVIATLNATLNSVKLTQASVQQASDTLEEAKYQTVYERQLDLWRLGAENKSLAPYLVGGKEPPEGAVNPMGTPTDPNAAEEAAQIHSALNSALDFYNYAFILQSPPKYRVLSYDANVSPPPGVDLDSWHSWVTWSWTIRSGFDGAPGMCDLIRQDIKSYEGDFGQQVLALPICARKK